MLRLHHISAWPEYGRCKRLGTLSSSRGAGAEISVSCQSKNWERERKSGPEFISSTKIRNFQGLCAQSGPGEMESPEGTRGSLSLSSPINRWFLFLILGVGGLHMAVLRGYS